MTRIWTCARPAAIFFLLTGPGHAEITIDNLMDSIEAVSAASPTESDCVTHVAGAADTNAAELFYGAVVCLQAGKEHDGTFLLLAGQVRALSDMEAFPPDGDAAEQTAATLWGLIFYQFGGTGSDDLHRDADRSRALRERFANWTPLFGPNYDPGWAFAARPEPADYGRFVAKIKDHRLRQIEHYAVLVSDPRYSAAKAELDEIQKRNPRGVVTGTDDAARMSELMEIMREIDRELR